MLLKLAMLLNPIERGVTDGQGHENNHDLDLPQTRLGYRFPGGSDRAPERTHQPPDRTSAGAQAGPTFPEGSPEDGRPASTPSGISAGERS